MKLHCHYSKLLILIVATLVIWGCSPTRYVPQDRYLLWSNKVEVVLPKDENKSDIVSAAEISEYIKQRPNRRIFGIGVELGFYNITDTSKHNKWHKFWGSTIGSAPVVFDSTLMVESNREIRLYLQSRGYLNAEVRDSVILNSKSRKASVHYIVNEKVPYRISHVDYNIEDPFIREIMIGDTSNSMIRVGQIYDRNNLAGERDRITTTLRNVGFYFFGNSSINYLVDSSWNDNTVSITMNVKRRITGYSSDKQPLYTNHPIYRVSRIIINTDFVPTNSVEENSAIDYDTLTYNGIEFLYRDKMYIRPEVLISAIRLSPNSLFDQSVLRRTNENITALGFNSTILFSPMPVDSASMTYVTIPTTNNEEVSTTEQQLECLIQCTPVKRQSFTGGFELSTTAAYSSLALTFGYQNRNLLGGAENFTANIRGAYEFMKDQNKNNSYELGVSTSLALPRFLLPIKDERLAGIRQRNTRISLNYNIQERPNYHRSIFGAAFGYGWTSKNGGKYLINPIDINVINVPWVDPVFLDNIDNPYLANSYSSQMVAGLSASYMYNSEVNFAKPGYMVRIMGDVNGNLLSMLDGFLTKPYTSDSERYYTFLGLRYSQYARASIDYSQRHNFNDYTQLAWRVFAGAGIPYGNSSTIPFERLYFAGGSNSMRGWQIRTLGPGGTSDTEIDTSYPYQLGDMRLEANLEFRFKIWGGLGMAVFMDAGNVWMNSKGRESDDANFRLNTFYKQIAFNTGAGLRWDFNFFLLRLDWGLKLHSPGQPEGQRWFKQMGFSDTVFHFAIGLPF